MKYITVTSKKPTSNEIRQIFKGMILGTDKNVEKSLFQLAAEKLESSRVQQHYKARFKVDSVSMNSGAKDMLKNLGLSRQQFEVVTA